MQSNRKKHSPPLKSMNALTEITVSSILCFLDSYLLGYENGQLIMKMYLYN